MSEVPTGDEPRHEYAPDNVDRGQKPIVKKLTIQEIAVRAAIGVAVFILLVAVIA